MSINDINILVNIFIKVSILGVSIYFISKIYKFFTTKYIDIKNKQIENEKMRLYSTVDPKLVKQELVNYIRDYTARYMTKNIMVNQIDFIKNDQMDEMVRAIIKDVVLNMSDLYLSYCKLLYTINTEEDLLQYIYYLTVDVVLDIVTEFNKNRP